MRTPARAVIAALAATSFLLCLAGFAPAAEEKKEDPKQFRVYWQDGIRLDSADKNFKLKIGGRIMYDWMWSSGDDAMTAAFGDFGSGVEVRRARLYVSGTVYGNVEFKAQYDFAGGDADMKDLYIGITGLPVGKLRAGHFKVPFSLGELTSSKYITFIERSLLNVLVPGRDVGFAVLGHSDNEMVTWGAGMFVSADGYGDAKSHGDAWDFAARLTVLPWSAGKTKLLHLGFGYHLDNFAEGASLRYSQRPEVHLTHQLVDTGSFAADSVQKLGLEAALVHGPLSLQGEYVQSRVSSPSYGDPTFTGYYVYASYFLTGESRAYKRSDGAFSRVKPKTPFSKAGGTGAWEVALRYSFLDLTDSPIFGGELSDVTLGVNWHLNNNTRVMFNYVYADRDGIGTASFVQTRFQIDF